MALIFPTAESLLDSSFICTNPKWARNFCPILKPDDLSTIQIVQIRDHDESDMQMAEQCMYKTEVRQSKKKRDRRRGKKKARSSRDEAAVDGEERR